MSRFLRHARGNVVGYLALFVALGGSSYAAISLPKNTVGARQIRAKAVGNSELRSSSVTSSKVRDGTLLSKDFKSGQLPAGATGPQGPKGDKGDTGPSTGAAGGDLTGTYPNPTIAAGAVTPSKISGVPTATVYADTSTPVLTSTNTPINFDGEEDDRYGMHDPAQPSKITAPIAGIYLVTGEATWDNNATGIRVLAVSASGRPRNVGDVELPASVTSTTDGTQNIATQIKLAAGETVQIAAFQNSGTTRSITSLSSPPETSTRFQMTWIAP